MIIFIVCIVFIINLYFVLRKKNNWFVIVFSVLCMFFVMAFNTYTTDYVYYEEYYQTQSFPSSFEQGFIIVSKIINSWEFEYQGFLIIYFLFGFVVVILSLRGIGANYHCIILLYSLTQMYMDTNEIRQFMAYCLFTVAVLDYAKHQRKIRYALVVILASLFHRSAIVFLLLLIVFAKMKNKDLILKFYFCMILAVCIGVYINENQIPGLSRFLAMVNLQDKAVYFESSTHLGFLKAWFGYFFNMLVVWIAKRELNRHRCQYSEIQHRYIENLWAIQLFSAFAMPLCMLSTEFMRFFKFSVFPVAIAIAIIINRQSLRVNRRCTVKLISFDLCIFVYLISYSISLQHYRVLGEVLNNNILNALI